MTRLLRGGFALPHDQDAGLVVLIRGKAGTGKSTLALQLLNQFESQAHRYYCTLEQSEEDVKFKLASIWAAQAIKAARVPDYKHHEGGQRGRFSHDAERVRKALGKCLKASFAEDLGLGSAIEAVAALHFPLYEELSSDDGTGARRISGRSRRTAFFVEKCIETYILCP